MSLNRKKSRPIHVGGIDYRYIVSHSRTAPDRLFKLNVTIENESSGSCLLVTGLVTRDYWLDFSSGPSKPVDYPVLLPQHIARFIQLAIADGWKQSQATYYLKLAQDTAMD